MERGAKIWSYLRLGGRPVSSHRGEEYPSRNPNGRDSVKAPPSLGETTVQTLLLEAPCKSGSR